MKDRSPQANQDSSTHEEISYAIAYWAFRLGSYAVITVLLLVFVFHILMQLYTKHGIGLRKDGAIRSTLGRTGYRVPDSAKLLYASKYYTDYSSDPQQPEPATLCTVFKLSESDFAYFTRDDLKKEGNLLDKGNLPPSKGCSRYRSQVSTLDLQRFQASSWERSGHSPYTVYVNKAERTVMFEIYFYD